MNEKSYYQIKQRSVFCIFTKGHMKQNKVEQKITKQMYL